MPKLSVSELEEVYDALARGIDRIEPPATERFLVRLALLLANELGDAARVQTLIAAASDSG